MIAISVCFLSMFFLTCTEGTSCKGFRSCDFRFECNLSETCFKGICIPSNASIDTCQSEADCPEQKTCVEGQCYDLTFLKLVQSKLILI